MNHEPLVRLYLRASTKDQDASRAKEELKAFVKKQGWRLGSCRIENVSGAKLERHELFRLLDDANEGDILLVEQVDRLSRLSAHDWERLKSNIKAKDIRIVALDLPTSYESPTDDGESFDARMLKAINNMMLDMLAAIARKDYEDRRRRQAQGITKAKADGKYKGRPDDKELQSNIATMLSKGMSYSDIQKAIGCSRATIAKVAKQSKA